MGQIHDPSPERCARLFRGRSVEKDLWGAEKYGIVDDEDPDCYADLLKGISWQVIEDRSKLSDKSWEEVRDVHDAWVLSELDKETANEGNNDDKSGEAKESNFMIRMERETNVQSKAHWEFFIFADDESVDSVVDADANSTRGQAGTYFITVVQSNFVCKSEMGFEDSEEEDYEEQELDPVPREANWQRFKMWTMVDVYASLLSGSWPRNGIVGEDGLSGYLRYDPLDI